MSTDQPLADRLRRISRDDATRVWLDLSRSGGVRAIPNTYRVQEGRPFWRAKWQCEWDDWTEPGAFRSYWVGRAIRKAQRARTKFIDTEARRRAW